ncbi:MAG: M23 family metallopeptidase [Bacteriovoracaceae bacterium]
MDRALTIVFLLTLISCSRWQIKADQEDKIIQPVNLEIRPGELLKVDFRVSDKNVELKCKGKKIPYFIDGEIGIAFIVESYFSKLTPYSCSLGEDKIFDVKVTQKEFPSERLHVDKRKVFYSKKDLKRIRAEQKVLNKIYKASLSRPIFNTGFKIPLNSKITSIYGARRLFNNKKKSQHLGTDFRAKVGTPIMSSNAGKVVLSQDLFFTGDTVIIDHGLGLFTVYGHLSKRKAEVGEFVPKGSVVGHAGMSGRATGPHLHWGVKVHGEWVDGASLVKETADEKI